MTLPYNPNIPYPTNLPSTDQPDMLINTNSIQSAIQVDHEAFNTGAHTGAHNQAQFKNLGTAPGTVPAGLIGASYETMYANNGATLANGELWFVRGGGATGIQLTGPGTPSATSAGYSFLPGGLVIQWDTVTIQPNESHWTATVTYPTSFQTNTLCVVCTLQPNNNLQTDTTSVISSLASSYSAASFDYVFNGTNSNRYPTFTYIAIGY